MVNIEQTSFCVVDVETASLPPDRPGRVCEIGAIKTADGKEVARFETLVNPQEPVSEDSFRVHGISDEMLRGAPNFPETAPRFLEFCRGSILVAHNTGFDLPVINAELGRAGLPPWKGGSICTVRLSRKAFQGLPSYSLDSLSRFFNLEFSARHRAMGDCEVTQQVFWRCVNRLREARKIRTLAELLEAGWNRHSEDRKEGG